MAHPVTDALASATSHAERQAIKAAAFVALPKADRKVKVGKYTVALVDHPVIGPSGLLEFHIRITKGNQDVTPPDMVGPDGAPGHMRIWNPPLCVDDPAGDIVETSIDPVTEVVTTRKLREDPAAALIAIVGRIVDGLP
jgi:hypothetical protein